MSDNRQGDSKRKPATIGASISMSTATASSARAEMHDVAVFAAETGCQERLNVDHVDDHCQHSSRARPNG